MATATKRKEKLLKLSEAAKRLGFTNDVVRRMLQYGFFTERRSNPISDRAHFRIFADEIDRYLKLVEDGLQSDRIFTAMRQYRIEAGRLKV